MEKDEVEIFLKRNVVAELRGENRTLVFFGIIKSCGATGAVIDNGLSVALMRYEDIIQIREKNIGE